MTEDEMAGWHHRLNGREFELTPGVGDGQGGLVSCVFATTQGLSLVLRDWPHCWEERRTLLDLAIRSELYCIMMIPSQTGPPGPTEVMMRLEYFSYHQYVYI